MKHPAPHAPATAARPADLQPPTHHWPPAMRACARRRWRWPRRCREADCQVQSMPDASPTKWHLAHVTWFFETFVLERFEAGFKPHHAAFRVLFNSYYHGVGEQHPRPQRGLITRPGLAEVKAYRAAVDERMAALLAAARRPRRDEIETARRARPAARAAAPGTDAHRRHAPAVVQPAGAGLPAALAAGHGGAGGARLGASSAAAWSRSGTTARASPSTTRRRATRSTCAPTRWATAWSRMASGSTSSTTAATATRAGGSSAGWDWVRAQAHRGAAVLAARRGAARRLDQLHPARPGAGRPAHADHAHQLLRGRRLRALAVGAGPAHADATVPLPP